jgi:hypothetical protein
MPTNVLLLGRTEALIHEAKQQLEMPDIELITGTSTDDVRSAFKRLRIDHVIMGGGIDLEDRLMMVREIYELSATATVHMKNRVPGPESFVPFARSVLSSLSTE